MVLPTEGRSSYLNLYNFSRLFQEFVSQLVLDSVNLALELTITLMRKM